MRRKNCYSTGHLIEPQPASYMPTPGGLDESGTTEDSDMKGKKLRIKVKLIN
jgi:hypothetical protein